VLYHLLVMLEASDVGLAEVMAALKKRTSQSGIVEKASRPAKGSSSTASSGPWIIAAAS